MILWGELFSLGLVAKPHCGFCFWIIFHWFSLCHHIMCTYVATIICFTQQALILLLIPIFVTPFLRGRFNQAQLPYGFNSCIILYLILLDWPKPMRHSKEIKEVWFWRYGSVSSKPFAWAQHVRATKWVRDTSSTLGSWSRSCI